MSRGFGAESINPRERRAYAHSMIEAHRRREVSFFAAEMAIKSARGTQKGKASGFEQELINAAGYESVRDAGSEYQYPSWGNPGPERHHYIFVDKFSDIGRNPIKTGTEQAWLVLRDELVVRGYGIHDAGHGNTEQENINAIVIDKDLTLDDKSDLLYQYGVSCYDDPVHQTSFI